MKIAVDFHEDMARTIRRTPFAYFVGKDVLLEHSCRTAIAGSDRIARREN